jgi:phage-related protein
VDCEVLKNIKKVDWIGSSKKDLLNFPREVQKEIGLALSIAQHGGTSPQAKLMKGFGSSVFEIAERFDKDAYRAVYVAHLGDRIYVLHCFQKKSKRGIATPKQELETIRRRLKIAQADSQRRN